MSLRKWITIGSLLLTTKAAAASEKQNTLTVNPIGLAFGAANVKFEHALSANGAIQVSGLFFLPWTGVSGIGAGIGYSFYPLAKAPGGLYITPNLSASILSAASVAVVAIGVAGDVGYKWIWDGGFALGLGAGVGYSIVGAADAAGNSAAGSGFSPRLAIDLGGAW